jgi:hypothetical protein
MGETKIDYEGRTNLRPDHDFPLASSKTYGKGRDRLKFGDVGAKCIARAIPS